MDRGPPNYILLEETQMEEIRKQAIGRYEEKMCYSKKKIVKKCVRNLEKMRPRIEEGRWERKRTEMSEGVSKPV